MVKAMPKEVVDKNIIPQVPLGRLGEPEEIALHRSIQDNVDLCGGATCNPRPATLRINPARSRH
jgi:hypothetical protein